MLRNTDHVSEPARLLKAIKGSFIVCVCIGVCATDNKCYCQIKEWRENVCVSVIV